MRVLLYKPVFRCYSVVMSSAGEMHADANAHTRFNCDQLFDLFLLTGLSANEKPMWRFTCCIV